MRPANSPRIQRSCMQCAPATPFSSASARLNDAAISSVDFMRNGRLQGRTDVFMFRRTFLHAPRCRTRAGFTRAARHACPHTARDATSNVIASADRNTVGPGDTRSTNSRR